MGIVKHGMLHDEEGPSEGLMKTTYHIVWRAEEENGGGMWLRRIVAAMTASDGLTLLWTTWSGLWREATETSRRDVYLPSSRAGVRNSFRWQKQLKMLFSHL